MGNPFGMRDAEFTRGNPFSMREGAKTVVSHGLWFNFPDYDTPTQLVKPLERNYRQIDLSIETAKFPFLFNSLNIMKLLSSVLLTY